MTTAISPRHTDDDFKNGWTLDDKIEVFISRIEGWQLGVAQEMIDKGISDRGFGLLMIVVSYFEMIAKYRDGFIGETQSGDHFKKGVLEVFPSIQQELSESDDFLNLLYKHVRNGLYHVGMTKKNVLISDKFPEALGFAQDTKQVFISADKLVKALVTHFSTYAAELRNPANVDFRKHFELRFDKDNN